MKILYKINLKYDNKKAFSKLKAFFISVITTGFELNL